jgi:hypothetical protein
MRGWMDRRTLNCELLSGLGVGLTVGQQKVFIDALSCDVQVAM